MTRFFFLGCDADAVFSVVMRKLGYDAVLCSTSPFKRHNMKMPCCVVNFL